MHFIGIIFEYLFKFLENKRIELISRIILIIATLSLTVQVIELHSKNISYDERLQHNQKSITVAFDKINDLDRFIRNDQNMCLHTIVNILNNKK